MDVEEGKMIELSSLLMQSITFIVNTMFFGWIIIKKIIPSYQSSYQKFLQETKNQELNLSENTAYHKRLSSKQTIEEEKIKTLTQRLDEWNTNTIAYAKNLHDSLERQNKILIAHRETVAMHLQEQRLHKQLQLHAIEDVIITINKDPEYQSRYLELACNYMYQEINHE